MSVSSRLFVAVAGLSLGLVHCGISNAGGGPDVSDASGEASRPADGAGGDAPGDGSSSADANPPPDGNPPPDANPPADGATADGNTVDGNDSSATDGAGDGSADAATCRSIAQECAAATADLACGTIWSTAQQPSTWCSRVPNATVYTARQCDGFDIVVLGGNDASSFYYYDPQTGALVGIETRGNGGPTCVAGQAPDVPLTDCYDAGGVSIVTCEADGSFTD